MSKERIPNRPAGRLTPVRRFLPTLGAEYKRFSICSATHKISGSIVATYDLGVEQKKRQTRSTEKDVLVCSRFAGGRLAFDRAVSDTFARNNRGLCAPTAAVLRASALIHLSD